VKTFKVVVLAVVSLSTGALAQTPSFSSSPAPYAPLVGATNLTFSSTDDAVQSVTLPFAFPWFGASYNTLYVNTNGFVNFTLPSGCTVGSCFITGLGGIPTTNGFSPDNLLAVFADDLIIPAGGAIRTLSSPTEFTVEWSNLNAFGGGYTAVSFQLKLFATGDIRFAYGPKTVVTPNAGSAAAGYEDPTGLLGASVLGTGCTFSAQATCCSRTLDNCTMNDFQTDTQIFIGVPSTPDLFVESVSIANFQLVQPSNDFQFDVRPTLRNYSTAPANNWIWRVFLSPDRFRDVVDAGTLPDGGAQDAGPINDILVFESGPTSLAAGAVLTPSGAAFTTTPPPISDYFVLVEVDALNQVAEFSETNNVGALPYAVTNGVDVVATGITGVASSGPDTVDSLRVQYFNRGATSAGTVEYRIVLTSTRDAGFFVFPDGGPTDRLADGGSGEVPGTRVIHRGTRTVSGGETVDEAVTVTMPFDAPQGDFFYTLQLDPAGTLAETNERNNVAFSSASVSVRRADLLLEAIDVIDPVTRVPVRNVVFGEPYTALVRFRNQGGASARNFRIGVILSNDSVLSLLSDPIVAEELVTASNFSTTSTNLEIPFTLPVVDRADAGLPGGNYYFFISLDTLGAVIESNKGNNSNQVGPVRALSPAPDYAVSTLQAPAGAGIGEVLPVFRTIRNIGTRDAAQVPYRYFASANTIITTSDVPLDILPPDGGTSLTGEVQLARGAASSGTDLVRLPASMPPGAYSVGCVVDPAGGQPELNRTNNSLASNVVQVSQSSLRVDFVQLPDATVGRPYLFQLDARGEDGPSVWGVETAQGALPAGLTLSANGQLSGTPLGSAGTGVRAFTVKVANTGRQATGRLVLRVLPATTQVEITSPSIPAIVNSPAALLQYPLGAAGGSKPYVWRVAAGTLPSGLTFSADGVLGGAPRAGTMDGIARVTFEVRDLTGGTARKEFTLRLLAAGSIVLRTNRLSGALVGRDYTQDVAVQNADGSALAKPLKWTVSGTLPPGLSTQEESEVLVVSGRPTRAGTFTFSVSVEDARGRSDNLDYTVTVYTNRFRIIASNLPTVVNPGQTLGASFATNPAGTVKWKIAAGALPAGVTLSESGALGGTVEDLDASIGTFTFVVEATDPAGATGLAPFAFQVERPVRQAQGCSSSGSGLAPLALLGALGLLTARRTRRRLGPIGLAAALGLPIAALAQNYQITAPTPVAYTPLPSTRTRVIPQTFSGVPVTLPFSFTFFGTAYTEVTVTRFGYLALAGAEDADSSNERVPHNSSSFSAPITFIAPWWDDHQLPLANVTPALPQATVNWIVTGAAPNRIIAFEWRDVARVTTANSPRFSFQTLLYEGTNQIRFLYGPTAPAASSASIGIQGSANTGFPGLTCASTAACASTDWPANQAIDLFLPPDLKVARLAVDQTGYSGVRYGATAFVRNDGGRTASNVTVRFFLSADAVLNTNTDLQIGDATIASVPVGVETAVAYPGALPASATTGSYFVFAVADPANAIVEQDENNNAGPPVTMVVGNPKADLDVSLVTAPATSSPGGMVSISRTLANVGNAPAASFKFTYLLSDNNVVSISDRALSPVGTNAGLAAAATDATAETVALPADLPPGTYWLGVCVNFDGANATQPFPLDEISVVNNCTVAAASTVVSTGTLTVLTTTLPSSTQYAPYGLKLRATGGNGVVTWAVTAGLLPPGMALASDGTFSGAPARTGSFGFTVTATSGAITATQALSLQVAAGSLPLVIVDQDLPGAEFGRAYSASLIAVGGRPPYRWALRPDAVLPEGLALSGDGFLEGRATESGEKPFEVEVTDSAGAKVARELKVRVVNPTTLAIGTTALVRGVLRQTYLQRLVAVGGRAPYTWAVTRFQQLPQNPTESPGAVATALPESFGLSIQDGVTEDFLAGTPRQSGLFSLTLKVTDGTGTEDTVSVTLLVTYAEGLAITTTVLPDAFLNQSYAVKLSHNGGRDVQGLVFSAPCIRQATQVDQFDCLSADPSQTLPLGLALGGDGSILGVPTGDPTTYTFLVKVADEAGRQDLRGLSIRVRADFATTGGQSTGCSSGGAGGSLAVTLLAGLTMLRRRRG